VFRAESRLVEVYATVVDHRGRYIDDLRPESFRILDEGAPQPIVGFENGASDFSCAILLDTTGSMTEALPKVKNAIRRLIDQFRDGDWVAVYGFSTGLELLQDFSRDKAAAKAAVSRTRAEGGTALFDALARVTAEIFGRKGKKAVVVFTDGDDNASVLNVQAAIKRSQKMGVPLYTAAEGAALRQSALFNGLKDLAQRTGGKTYAVKRLADTDAIFQDISEELRHTYLLSYKPPAAPDQNWRQIQLRLSLAGNYKIRAKEGYYP
jgi:VWFA-related protein